MSLAIEPDIDLVHLYSIFLCISDNGGLPSNGGNNYPLKGGKNTLWEGGIRGVAFLHGTQLENPNRVTHQLLHVSDWFPTILKLAGGDISSLSLDGYDVSSTIRQVLVSNISNSKKRQSVVCKTYST